MSRKSKQLPRRETLIGSEDEAGGVLVGYARVSTIDQSLRLQVDALKRAGVTDEFLFVEKMSGASRNRPQFLRALKLLRPGWTLVFWKLDRVARDLGHLLKVSEEVREKGAALRSLTEQIDTKTAMGSFFFHMLGAFAQFERDMTRERTMAGMQALKERGAKFGRPPKLTPKDMKAIERDLKRPELTVKEIAAKYGVSPGTINAKFPGYRTGKNLTTLRGRRQPAVRAKRKKD